jgi:hypothetical protein
MSARSSQVIPSLLSFRLAPLLAALTTASIPAQAAPKRGDGLQTDGLSTLLVSRDFSEGATTSIASAFNLSEVIGLHYYFVDRVRLGMSVQLTERVAPEPEPGSSRLQRVAFLPQVGWNFWDPFYTALAVSYAPRTRGRSIPDVALMAVLGAGAALSDDVRFSVALEAPWAFRYHQTLGLVLYSGLGFRF